VHTKALHKRSAKAAATLLFIVINNAVARVFVPHFGVESANYVVDLAITAIPISFVMKPKDCTAT
jgi:hypothetical protein